MSELSILLRSNLSYFLWAIPVATLVWLEPQQQAIAQIVPANDGMGTVVNQTGADFAITGGSLSGDASNLFHNFSEFNLTQSQSATFFANPNIQNILSNISGGNPSIIDGLLRVQNSDANLFLLNPAGFVFGENAQLDISGSFAASTATRVGFGDEFLQSFGVNDYAALNGNPTSFVFDSTTGTILNQANLTVSNGESLWLIGNSVLNLDSLSAPDGNISLTAIPEQRQIKISQPGGLLSLTLDAIPFGGTALPDDINLLQATDLAQYLTGSEEHIAVGDTDEIVLQQGDKTIQFAAGDVGVAGEIVAASVQLMATGLISPTDFSLIRAGEGDRQGLTVVRFRENLEDSLGYTFIDQRADNPDQLLFGGESGTIATIVLKQEAGLEAVTNALLEFAATGETLDVINIVAEGNEGYFWLGSDLVDGATLEAYQAQLQQWRSVLGNGADLLLYSCFTALGMNGDALLTQLADLTGADVAASLDVTGSDEFGGNWELEYSTGDIEASNPFTVETLATWEGKLATILVQNLNDSGANSLRNAFAIANPGDLIIPTISGTVFLTTGEIFWGTDDLTLDGFGENFAVDGSNSSRIFRIFANDATIENVIIQNGNSGTFGGGIYNTGTLTVENVTIAGNTANFGGGIANTGGTATIVNSTISGNTANNTGGGIYNSSGGDLTLVGSVISGNDSNGSAGDGGGGIKQGTGFLTIDSSLIANNFATDSGGGIQSRFGGDVEISNSTISGNTSQTTGGGISQAASNPLRIENSTISGNVAYAYGGGIYNQGILTITSSTITGNDGLAGGGVYAAATADLTNSIVANNIGGDWVASAPSASGINIIRDGSVTGFNILNVNPLISGLGDFGGFLVGDFNTGLSAIPTHFLLPGSPAIDAGDDAFVGTSFDQRGGDRQVGIVDIGAVEFQGTELIILEGNNQTALTNTEFPLGLTLAAVENIFGNPLEGIGVDFFAPMTGASTNPTSFFDVTDIFGEVSIPISANSIVGTFDVFAFADTGDTVFTLNNTNNPALVSEGDGNENPFFGDLFFDDFFFNDPIFEVDPAGNPDFTGGGPGRLSTFKNPDGTEGGGFSGNPDRPFRGGGGKTPQEKNPEGIEDDNPDVGDIPPDAGIPDEADTIAVNPAIFAAELEQAAEYGSHLNRQFPTPLTSEQSQSLLATLNDQTDTKTAYISFRFRSVSNNLASERNVSISQLRQSKINKSVDPLKPWLSQIPRQTSSQDPLEIIITTADNGIVVKTLPFTRQELLNLERELLRVITSPNQLFKRRLDRVLTSLHQQIITPVEATLQDAEIDAILLSLGQGLRSIPWAALYDGEQYLIEKYGLSITPNLSLTDTTYRPLHNREVLAMGASDFTELNALPAVPTELALISQQFNNAEYFLNEEFTQENLLAARDRLNPGIIHLATHASFQGGDLSQSYIQLWGEERLAINEMEQLQWFRNPPIELLVLSACQTALGNPEAELGFGGLAIKAGVRSAVASLWDVSDVGTMALMTEFYQNLRDPNIRTKSEALRQAQIALIRGEVRIEENQLRGGGTRSPYTVELGPGFTTPTDNSLAHPYFWSAFTMIGSPW